MNIGIFSGSFNPIHAGHLILANYITEYTEIDEVWLLVTPHNPIKEPNILIDEDARLEMTKLALENYPQIRVSDVEFSMPRPSYTINTLKFLTENHPEHSFSLIIGADNWQSFERWKDYEEIIEQYKIFVYPRFGYSVATPAKYKKKVEILNSPIIEISSTFIREGIREGKNLRAFMPDIVYRYIKDHNLYT